MKVQRSLAAAAVAGITLLVAACGGTESLGRGGSGTVTVYSADGLGAWYFSQFYKFTKLTGIEVNLVEAGSGEVVSRVEREQSNPQADLLVTVPPFIQKAEQSGLLQTVGIDTSGIEASLIDRAASPCRSSRMRCPSSRTRRRIHNRPVGTICSSRSSRKGAVLDTRPSRRWHSGVGAAAAPDG